jgi:hypothetical protein
MPFLLRPQLIDFRRDHHKRPAVLLEPVSQLDVFLHPAPSRIQDDDAQTQSPAIEQVPLDERLPFGLFFTGNFSEPIPWKIDEPQAVFNLVEIDQLRTARPGTGTRQLIGIQQRIQQAGFADITAAQKCDLSSSLRWKLIRSGCTYYKPSRHSWSAPSGQFIF